MHEARTVRAWRAGGMRTERNLIRRHAVAGRKQNHAAIILSTEPREFAGHFHRLSGIAHAKKLPVAVGARIAGTAAASLAPFLFGR